MHARFRGSGHNAVTNAAESNEPDKGVAQGRLAATSWGMTEPPPRPAFSPIGIGAESRAPFALLPDPRAMFRRRAARFRARSEGGARVYLAWLADIAETQAACVPAVAPLDAGAVARSAEHGLPPIDRLALKHDAELAATVRAFLEAMRGVAMPVPAIEGLTALLASPEMLADRIGDALEDAVPMGDMAPYVFAAAGVQVHLAALAASLDAAALVPVGDGVCPCCGGPPAVSMVVERAGAHGARFAVCAACATEWNVVRVKCVACGSTKGIGYQEIEGQTEGIQAETCDECGLYVKILQQDGHPELDPVADDVASMGLDIMLRESAWRRGGVNPFLAGY